MSSWTARDEAPRKRQEIVSLKSSIAGRTAKARASVLPLSCAAMTDLLYTAKGTPPKANGVSGMLQGQHETNLSSLLILGFCGGEITNETNPQATPQSVNLAKLWGVRVVQ